MKPIESYPDKKHCEMCGALVTEDGADSQPDHSATEVIRRLAFIADKCPSLAILLIHHIAGRTERDIAERLHLSQPTIHSKIVHMQKVVLSISRNKKSMLSIVPHVFA